MKQERFSEFVNQVLDELCTLLINKNNHYSGIYEDVLSNFKNELTSPEIGVAIRMQDKFSRLNTILKKYGSLAYTSDDESGMDTVKDLIGYCVLMLALHQDRQESVSHVTDKCEKPSASIPKSIIVNDQTLKPGETIIIENRAGRNYRL